MATPPPRRSSLQQTVTDSACLSRTAAFPATGSLPDLTTVGRSITAVSEGHKTTQVTVCRPEKKIADSLPADLLYRIFNHLPICWHASCALVCHLWYASLPDLRLRVAQWREQHEQAPQHPCHLTAAYSSRLRPWLTRSCCPFLPQLQCQYQELLQQRRRLRQADMLPHEKETLRQQIRRGDRLFSGLLQYSLHQTKRRADQLTIQPAPLHRAHGGTIDNLCISPCSRWLAVEQRHHEEQHRRVLLYGWQQGAWQPERLASPPQSPAQTFLFSLQQPNTLLSAHEDGRILACQRQVQTGLWRHSLIHQHHPAPDSQAFALFSFADGGLCVLYKTPVSGQLLLIGWQAATGHWGMPRIQDYPLRPPLYGVLTWSTAHRQLALTEVSPPSHPCFLYNARTHSGFSGFTRDIHIWEHHASRCQEEAWRCRVSTVVTCSTIEHMMYSPDGRCLLLLTAGHTALWQRDTNDRLQLQLTVPRRIRSPYWLHCAQFSRDSRRLAVIRSRSQIDLWACNNSRHWHQESTLTLAAPSGGPRSRVRYIKLCCEGTLLVQVGSRVLHLWHRDSHSGRWQPGEEDGTESRLPPTACALPPDGLLHVTATGRASVLRLHGLDRAGRLVRKGHFHTGAAVRRLYPSPDGLSLMVFCQNGELVCLQLGPCAAGEAAGRHTRQGSDNPPP